MENRLLVIDSEAFDSGIMRRIFSSISDVCLINSVTEIDSTLKSFKPDVVYFEMRLPQKDQLSKLFRVLKRKSPASLVIISVTENSVEIERYARINNVFYYLIRPFNLKELWDVIECGFETAKKGDKTDMFIDPDNIDST